MEKTVVVPIGSGLDGGTSGGTADAQTVTLAATPTLAAGLIITFTAGFTNTTAMTLNANSTGSIAVRIGRNRRDLSAGDILAGSHVTVYYDGSNYVLMASDGACPCPPRWLGHKALYMQDRGLPVTYMPASGLNNFMYNATSDTPLYFTVEGDCIRLDPKPAQNGYLNVTYYKRPQPLETELNDIFDEAPSIYLYASLLELAIFLPAEERIASFMGLYKEAVNAYRAADNASQRGYAPMRMRMSGNVP
jgi:hypothetical protein